MLHPDEAVLLLSMQFKAMPVISRGIYRLLIFCYECIKVIMSDFHVKILR